MTILLISSTWRGFGASGVAAVFLLAGCLNSSTVSWTVHDDPILLVRLDSPVPQEEVSGGPGRDIAELTAADLAAVLRSVRIQPEISFISYWILRKEPQPEPAFPNGDAALLAAHLRAAFATARPNETAVFFLRRAREDGIPLVTTGALTIHGDQLIVLLANARRPATTQRKLDAARETPLRLLGDLDFHFVSGPYQTKLAKNDLPKPFAITSAPGLSINYGAFLSHVSQPGRSATPSQTETEISTATIEQKLHRLKSWHEQGLITEHEYLQKRQELLQQF